MSCEAGENEAVIFDIEGFAVNDGPGIRTTVFFKGCPLKCVWCHNPEGLSSEPELCVKAANCTGCGKCLAGCSHPECQRWGRCLHICPNGNISVAGETYDTATLAGMLIKDKDIFISSGGGVTFSGGEPLIHVPFIGKLIPKLSGIHTAVETCGYISGEDFNKSLKLIDYFIFDLKLFGRDKHKQYTGVYNDVIHLNLLSLQLSGRPHLIRIPLIPGITDDEDNIRGLAELAGDSKVQLLPYNVLAGAKYANFRKKYPLADLQAGSDKVNEYRTFFNNCND